MENTNSMSSEIEKYKVYLAALLHDIGKFYQRADDKTSDKFCFLKNEHWKLDSTFCPKFKNRYSHKHVLWTAQFISDNIKSFQQALGNADGLERLAAIHHAPQENNVLERIIQKADHWSSGIDRTTDIGQKDADDESKGETKWDYFKRVRMCSVFESLFKEKHLDDFKWKYKLPVSSLQLETEIFPNENISDPNYEKLWIEFNNEFKKIKTDNPQSFCDTLLNLLYKYTFSVPSSTQHLPDVSLFDHSKTVAAFAICIYDYLKETNNLQKFEIAPDEEVILLIGGDVSGIQSYLYDIVSQQASKNLKGRSFYLQLLVDSVIEKILSKLKLPKANVVYASGGGFYLLVPNTESTIQQLKEIETELSEKLFAEHRTSLFLAIDNVSLSEKDLYTGLLSEKWKNLIEKLNIKKRKRFKEKINHDYNSFFEPIETGGKEKRDTITNEEIFTDEKFIFLDENHQDPVKATTYAQIELGRNLKNTQYLITSKQALPYLKKDFIQPCNLGVYYYFLDDKFNSSIDDVNIDALNNTSFLNGFAGKNNSLGFDFYGGNDFPIDEKGNPKIFDVLAQTSDEDPFKRLGVLRMDVDNLGQVFINGFREDRRTFSRYSTLSRSLDYFFKGYINKIWQDDRELKEFSYIVYSGGDDLFIVGKWDTIICFAEKIYHSFRQWSCQNDNLGISAGIAIVPSKFPIMKAAEMSGDAEKKAKNHRIELNEIKTEKNSICLLDVPLHWDKEFPLVKQLKIKLVELIPEKLPHSLISKINSLYEMQKEQREKKQNESWQWILAYNFARTRERHKKDESAVSFLKDLERDIICDTFDGKKFSSSYSFLKILNLSARWAEMELRNKIII